MLNMVHVTLHDKFINLFMILFSFCCWYYLTYNHQMWMAEKWNGRLHPIEASEERERAALYLPAQYKTLVQFLKVNPEYKTAYEVSAAILQDVHGNERTFSAPQVKKELSGCAEAIPIQQVGMYIYMYIFFIKWKLRWGDCWFYTALYSCNC